MMTAQTDSVLNMIRGKNLVAAATRDDVNKLFDHIDALEDFLDDQDEDDVFGTEGWRHLLGLD